ncbi:uncharacterized protein [Procambarus clarkii]|uniref:uncharacterized protein n=1 Tax=Procambarus clarkii TaxID=6728 RepID=UPI00374220FA
MTSLALSLMLLTTQVIFGFQVTWKLSGSNTRYINANRVILSTKQRNIICAIFCSQMPTCVSFNHYNVDDTCELMNVTNFLASDPSLYAAPGWSHYNISSPRGVMEAKLCPPGSFLLPYDLPPAGSGFNLTVEGYTCSNHAWILKQRNLGKTDCRLVLNVSNGLNGYDFPDVFSVSSYSWALQQCMTHACASMVCGGSPVVCYLKYESHLTLGVSDSAGINKYWYVNCQ